MNMSELRTFLEKQGWAFGKPLGDTGVHWYAWEKQRDLPDCRCNDKPPSLILKPCSFRFTDGRIHETVEFEMTGESAEALLGTGDRLRRQA